MTEGIRLNHSSIRTELPLGVPRQLVGSNGLHHQSASTITSVPAKSSSCGWLTSILQCIKRLLCYCFPSERSARPFLPGQPIGLDNGIGGSNNNCWLNTIVQLATHVPSYGAQIARNFPAFSRLLDGYRAAEAAQQGVLPNSSFLVDQLRFELNQRFPSRIRYTNRQEDVTEGLGALMEPAIDAQRNQAEPFFDTEQMNGSHRESDYVKKLTLPTQPAHLSDLVEGEFASFRLGPRRFRTAPSEILFQYNRFAHRIESVRETTGFLCFKKEVVRNVHRYSKVSTAIQSPDVLSLPPHLVGVPRGSLDYRCDAFTVHIGDTPGHGHYVFYVKKGPTWWRVSDDDVTSVSDQEAADARKYAYLVHYTQTN